MVTTVKLQDPFEYSWYVVLMAVILGIITIVLLTYAILKIIKLNRLREAKKPKYTKIRMSPEVLWHMKRNYMMRVQALYDGYRKGAISKRDGYQKLSAIIRSFVHEVTGINVENFTVKEVKAMGIRKLDVLMEEYYVPEFAEDEKAMQKDFAASCNVAIGVIKTWS